MRKIVHKFHVSGLFSLLLLVVLYSAAEAGKCLFLVFKTRLSVLDSKAGIATVYSCVFTCVSFALFILRLIPLTFNSNFFVSFSSICFDL